MHMSDVCICFLIGVITFDQVLLEPVLPVPKGNRLTKRSKSQQSDQHGEHGNLLQDNENVLDEPFKVTVNSSSPAVLDSIVKFAANLSSLGKLLLNETTYTYVWENTANAHELTSYANFSSSVKIKDFSSVGLLPVMPGEYHMKVTVYKRTGLFKLHVKVAHGSTRFRLTKNLNGNMIVAQNLTRKKEKLTYATKRPLNFTSVLTDVFERNYTYAYIWYVNETFQEWNMNRSSMNYSGNWTGILNVTLEVKATSTIDPPLTKIGVFKKYIDLEDEINITSISHDKEIDVGDPVSIDIYYNGSTPIHLSWVLLNVNGTLNHTVIHGNKRNFSIHLPDDLEKGTYYLNITMENDVSLLYTQTSFSVIHHKGTVLPTVSITVTVAFCVVGIIVTLAALVYSALRYKQKEHVTETADFNFHPHIKSRSKLTPIIKNLMNLFLERGKFSNGDSSIRQDSSRTRTYGSIEIADDEGGHLNPRSDVII